ncbi:hypothetical protein [Loigolactobacillus coryniformis]|uniref:hypothetical protein n=1 Tax=Loigolactobacillus coryniformis TaxID=1610 RepID=UPI003F52518B
MQHNKYGYVCSTETKIFSDLDKWLADKKKRERRAKKHGAFSLEKNKEVQHETTSICKNQWY